MRERPVLLAIAWGLLLVSGALGALWAVHDPAAAVDVVPRGLQGVAEPHSGIPRIGGAQATAVSSQIFTNNIRVTFLSFAAGITAGIGTAILLLYNGLLLGVVGGLGVGLGSGGQFVSSSHRTACSSSRASRSAPAPACGSGGRSSPRGYSRASSRSGGRPAGRWRS